MKNFGEKTKRWFKSLFVQTDGNEPKMLTFIKKEEIGRASCRERV